MKIGNIKKDSSIINRPILQILSLYFSLIIMLFLSIYLMMPSFFNINIIILNILPSSLAVIASVILIKHKSKNNTIKNCNTIYSICKNFPVFLLLISVIFSIIVVIFCKNTNRIVLSLIFMYTQTIFYIFSQKYYNDILNYSEKYLRPKTESLVSTTSISKDIPIAINLILEILPLIFLNLLIALNLLPITIASLIYIVSLLIISTISLIYISLHFYININSLSNNTNTNLSYNNELGSLSYELNANKEIHDNYIKDLESERLASVEIIRRTVDARDTYTRGHSDRVAEYSYLIGEKLGLSQDTLDLLKVGGLFHDIGKIGIRDVVLLKEGRLDDAEYAEIKKHPSIGAHILENSGLFDDIIPMVLHHHERYDGRGYPSGLKGDEIPFLARIISVADTFDAMTSKRVYRNSLPLDVVKAEFEKCSGSQFDPVIAAAFLDILNNEYDKIEKIIGGN